MIKRMSVNEILTEVRKLSPAEREQLVNALLHDQEARQDVSLEERQAELLKRLHAEGAIKNIPPRRIEGWDFEPVPIKGQPLSETIIEERR